MSSLVGQTIGRYRILEEIGAGGMGVVYRAHDERLDRDLAVKVLSPGTLDDPAARKRFRNEALVLSRLNHPAIQTIHDFETQDGRDFLVSELVPGTSLDAKLEAGAQPEKETVRLGVQLAQGLAAAHGEGVLHRDLKPANLRVTPDGRLKILDFGLATSQRMAMAMTTVTDVGDPHGSVGGTLPYMSPEQLLSEKLDERSDLYSAGAVLYEMATGRRPFPEINATRLTDDILHHSPTPPTSLNRKLSPELERIVLKCLEKNPELRYQSAKELAADLRRMELLSESRPGIVAAVPGRKRRAGLAIAIGSAMAIGIAIAAALLLLRAPKRQAAAGPLQFEQITNFTDSAGVPALSPDGKILAFIRGPGDFGGSNSKGQVWIKMLPDGDPKQLTDTPSGKDVLAFSPDGSRIFFTQTEEKFRWNTWVVPVLGGEARLFLPNATGMKWIGPGRIMFSEMHTGVHMGVVTANESRTERRDIYWPPTEAGMIHRSSLSPDGKWVLMVEMDGTGWLPCRLVPFDGSSMGRPVGPPAPCTAVAWSPDQKWMYFTASMAGAFHLWRQPFPDGAAEQLTFGPTEEEGLAVAPDGKWLITAAGTRQSTVWVHDGNGTRQITSEGFAFLPTISPDGRKVYFLQRAGSSRSYVSGELWMCDLKSGSRERVLPGLVLAHYALSPDGKKVVFAITEDEQNTGLWIADLEARTPPRHLTKGREDRAFFGAPGEIVYQSEPPSRLMRMKEDGTSHEQVSPVKLLYLLSVSPDTNWAAAVVTPDSDAAAGTAILAFPLRGGAPVTLCDTCVVGFGPARTQSPAVGWSPDGKHLYLALRGFNIGSQKTAVLPLKNSQAPTAFNLRSFRAEKDFAAAGALLIPEASVFPGPSVGVYAFTRRPAQHNLFRIPLP